MRIKNLASIVLAVSAGAPVISRAAFGVTSVTTFSQLIGKVCSALDYVFMVFLILTVVFVIVAAFYYVTSSGDPEKVKKATKTITYAAIAVAVAIFAVAFPYLIASLFGGDISTTTGINNCGIFTGL